ncbi:hypothetical protein GTHT12_01167 [Geobacillus thermodenitrificans]|nr:hypothetical protein GTHT12_01167 [Geobacillus thermodenitrificans]
MTELLERLMKESHTMNPQLMMIESSHYAPCS